MNTKKPLIPLFALALGTAITAPARAGDVGAAAQDTVHQGVTVNVVNNNWLGMRVYVIVGSVRYRLGTVNGLGRQTLRVSASLVSAGKDIQLMALPFGKRGANYTRMIYVIPGDSLEYRIESQLALSNVFKQ